jgi:CNT family concentrative nucleoside transporter
VRPYLKDMTRSEFCTVLTVGMATVASNVLALYVFCLKDALPTIAAHLVSASILSAPAGLIMSKLLLPEDGQPLTLGVAVKPHYEREHSLFEAVISGAHAGARLILGIAVLLLAVLGLIALFDLLLGAVGGRVNTWCGLSLDWSLAGLLGYAFSPLTFMLGVPPEDVMTVSRLIGLRSVATEVAAYQALTPLVAAHAIAPRSAVITTYALCGFAHVASMAIFVGGITALVPERARAISAVGLRALAAATLACLLTACVAGVVYTAGVDSILLRSVHVP